VLDRLGFDRERIGLLNPKLIHCALSGYGQTGPYRQRVGHDINYCAASAMLSTPGQSTSPVIGFPPLADHAAAMQASIAMLAALHDRDRQRGVFLDIGLFEASLSWGYLPLLADEEGQAVDMLNGGAACYNLYRCADDRFISLGAIETGFWANFCNALQRPEWIERQFESMPQSELIAEVSGAIAAEPVSHWNALLDPIDCCFEPVHPPAGLPQHPQISARSSLGTAGPTYPGWIDGEPVEINDGFEEIDSIDKCAWR
jgi:crotonobetainyl-CoA:carnitine CoA-transferase CaiB-like acyl-CoA transferase